MCVREGCEPFRGRNQGRPTPATIPVDLASNCIALHGGDPASLTLLEPFLGIGNAAVAAGEAGIGRCLGFEIDETYFKETCGRLRFTP